MKTVKKETITKEMIEKAMACETPADLMKLAKSEGYEMTEAEAESYLSELTDVNLDSEQLKEVAGGRLYGKGVEVTKCDDFCDWRGH